MSSNITYLDLVQELMPDVKGQFLTIDTEDYTTTVNSGFDEVRLRQLPSNLVGNVEKLLDVFSDRGYHCTFFILGRIADRIKPQLRRMVAEGHEVASHGMSHRRILDLKPAEFKAELQDSKKLIEDLSGAGVCGFRAPMFSITNENLWAFDELLEAGYRYDSSISPVSNFAYGVKEAPKSVHRLRNGLIEVPMSVYSGLGYPLMLGGGFYLRVYPLWLHKLFFKLRNGNMAVYYLHPWELDSQHNLNLWDQIPDEGAHWSFRPKLMKFIEMFNRKGVMDKYMSLIESQLNSHSDLSRRLDDLL